ncbi:hypothetical protein XELAEV_18008177mg [Xenopus laevis]|uniref:Uncharacterized protein n=1 Tax=Xenopus laevis TaxID=8355 RepID=A0A974E387_XENLA|nr:hypothetical protein XELAEV_18008177mg [Xenopus laevis]
MCWLTKETNRRTSSQYRNPWFPVTSSHPRPLLACHRSLFPGSNVQLPSNILYVLDTDILRCSSFYIVIN